MKRKKQNSSFSIEKFDDREQWLNARNGKITGSKLKDIITKRGDGVKKGVYQLIADRIAIAPDGENPMDRGTRLEEEAIARFVKETGKKVNTDLVIFSRVDNPNIAFSPDAYIGDTEVVEAKCLSSASHIEALITQKVPSEYEDQIIQPFVVNDNLKTVYMVFYDPRIPTKDFFYLTINRADVEDKVVEYLEYEKQKLEFVEEWILKLSY